MPIALHTPQVTRIPIAGPEPYNTLVAVTAVGEFGPGGSYTEGDQNTYHSTSTVSTGFVIAGFDQRVTINFQHSTTAFLIKTPSAKADNFIYAVDAIATAAFGPEDGSYFVTVDTTIQFPDNVLQTTPDFFGGFWEDCRFCVSSFVLVYEPPLPGSPATPSGQGSSLTNRFTEKENFIPPNLIHKLTQKK